MKHTVTKLEGKNEPMNSILGNYFIELEPGNYQAVHQILSLISFGFHRLKKLIVKS